MNLQGLSRLLKLLFHGPVLAIDSPGNRPPDYNKLAAAFKILLHIVLQSKQITCYYEFQSYNGYFCHEKVFEC